MKDNAGDAPARASLGRVCMVAPVHVWDDVRVFHKEAVSLAGAGYDVVLLAQAPGRRAVQGVEVKRIWAPRTPRTLRFLALPLVLVQALAQRADVYHLHNPDTLPLCIALKLLGRRVVYDTHEDFSRRIGIREWIPRALRAPVAKCVDGAERLVGNIVDAAIATQTGVAARLGEGAVVIGNPPRADAALLQRVTAQAAARGCERGHGLRAIYVGLVGMARGLFDMVDAVELVNREHRARLCIIGPAVSKDLEEARNRPGWRHVDYHERMPQEDAFAHVVQADVGLAVLHDVADIAQADPNKLYEYMALGKPFIASAFAEWQARLRGADAGWFVSPGSVEETAAALEAAMDPELRKRKGAAGAAFVREYNWSAESEKLIAIYRRILSNAAPVK